MKRLTLELSAHIIMAVFAIASMINVGDFLVHADHNPGVAYALGFAVGGVVIVVSIALSKTDIQRHGFVFWLLLWSSIGAALLSGTVQFLNYNRHMPRAVAIIMGYGFPIFCEALLAVSVSYYSAAMRRTKIIEATDRTRDRIGEAMADALDDIDVSEAREYVERRVKEIVSLQVRHVMAEMHSTLSNDEQSRVNTEQTKPVQADAELSVKTRSDSNKLDEINAQRQTDVEQRRQRIVQIVLNRGDPGVTQLATELGVSRGTVYNDLTALESEGTIHRNGNGVEVLG